MSKASENVIVNLNADELKGYIGHIIDNNRFLQEKHQPATALQIMGESGIGKTSIIEQLAHERDMAYVKINLAQIGEEVSELVGYPIRQFEMCQGEECMWVDEQVVMEYKDKGFKFTGKNRTGYCPPEWIAGLNGKPGIFNLDDWTRGSMRTIQAVMEIISRQEYISWKLPKGWTVVLTANPSDGEYLVNETDSAQKSRYTSANLKFDIDCWSRFAEEIGLDGRCINFLLKHPEVVTKDCNPRSITTFFNSISSFKDFSANLGMIQMLGEGSVGPEFAILFTVFIENKLDLLISPSDMINGKEWSSVKKEMKACIGKPYRADIASILTTRIVNYSLMQAKEGVISRAVIERLIKLTTDDEVLASDLRYYIVKNLLGKEQAKFAGMMLDEEVQKMSMK